ncbi:hypothetical protein KKE14_01135 [Patescibacteria group bacterium]|nr:hypothetical protein [Patescibacteria group bacterium]
MEARKKSSNASWLLIIISIIIAFLLSRYQPFHAFLLGLGDWSYVGIFLTGILFVFTFTAATAIIIFNTLGEVMSPWSIGLIAGLGAALGDYLIFMFVRKHVSKHTKRLIESPSNSFLGKLFKNSYFRWVLPVVGGIIVALPFPDEIGIALLGISKIKIRQFVILAFVLHAVIITLVAMTGRII